MISIIINSINTIFSLVYILILIRCALSFLPSIDWNAQPFSAIRMSTDLYLDLFKKYIPPIGMIDISPVVAVIALGVVQNILILILSQFVH